MISNEGAAQFFTFSVTDQAGNSASFSVSNVSIDKTAPTINANRTPAANANGWNNTDVTANYTASDALLPALSVTVKVWLSPVPSVLNTWLPVAGASRPDSASLAV